VARDRMLKATDTKHAKPFRRQAEGAVALHFAFIELASLQGSAREKTRLPTRSNKGSHEDQASRKGHHFIPETY
jgi:hypothetical protein